MLEQNVKIIGAGIGGLVAALALKKNNTVATIYESTSSIEPVGAGIILSVNAMRVFERLGIAEEIKVSGHIVNAIGISNSKGSVLSKNDLRKIGEKFQSCSGAIHRARLHEILLSHLFSNQLFLGHRCQELDAKNNNIIFKNGDESDYELLIASDGMSSVVRDQLGIHSVVRDSQQVCYRGIAKMPDSFVPSNDFYELWGRGKRFGYTSIGGQGLNQVYWYATFNKNHYPDINKERVKTFLLSEFSDWAEVVVSIVSHQDDSSILRNDLFDKKASTVWSKGNVVLLGDAIHPTTPNLGQGAAMAIESAFVLANCLSTHKDMYQAINEYKNKRYKRTTTITNQSWQLGKMGNMHAYLPCLMRDAAIKAMPDCLMNQSAMRLLSYEC
jgi:2-polyprenyl-6-methoxyphenol hydroxylase-like FAD-dependent oxidoreductase